MRLKIKADPLARFYRDLLSSEWHRRLRAYDVIEADLRGRGYLLSEERWGDMKLLAGQVISIYFKHHVPGGLDEFREMLKKLYLRLTSPLFTDKTVDYAATQELLTAIYDDDDWVARREIKRFFQMKHPVGVREDKSILENLWLCYTFMMGQVQERSVSMAM
ncbi:MAG: hypothetical protein IJ849_09230 [Selenomonadaceae bacterium]|nr:hypothetical protein [Selenomonadaceae bacterium]